MVMMPDLHFVLPAVHSLSRLRRRPEGPMALPSMNCFTMGWVVDLTSATVPAYTILPLLSMAMRSATL